MSRQLGLLLMLSLLLLLGAAGLKLRLDADRFAAAQQLSAPRPPSPQLPSGLDGRTLNSSVSSQQLRPPAPPKGRP